MQLHLTFYHCIPIHVEWVCCWTIVLDACFCSASRWHSMSHQQMFRWAVLSGTVEESQPAGGGPCTELPVLPLSERRPHSQSRDSGLSLEQSSPQAPCYTPAPVSPKIVVRSSAAPHHAVCHTYVRQPHMVPWPAMAWGRVVFACGHLNEPRPYLLSRPTGPAK